MNTLRFYEAYSANAPSQTNSPRVTRRTSWNSKQQGDRPLCAPEEAEGKLVRLKDNFKVLQKQLEMCYNLICQVEASGGFSFEAAFRPKFWLISIVSPVHLIMGEKEKVRIYFPFRYFSLFVSNRRPKKLGTECGLTGGQVHREMVVAVGQLVGLRCDVRLRR